MKVSNHKVGVVKVDVGVQRAKVKSRETTDGEEEDEAESVEHRAC